MDTQNSHAVSHATAFQRMLNATSAQLFNLTLFSAAALMLLIVADVIMRNIFSFPILGAMEISELLMLMLIAPSFAYIQIFDTHLNVEMFTTNIAPARKAAIKIFIYATTTLFMAVLCYETVMQTYQRYAEGEYTPLMGITIWYFYAFMLICLLVLICAFINTCMVNIAALIKQKQLILLVMALLCAACLFAVPMLMAGSTLGIGKGALGGLLMLFLFALLLTSMPIGLAMLITGMVGIILVLPSMNAALGMIGNSPFISLTAGHLSVIPMFVLMGELALIGGVSADLFRAASTWLGGLPGGLAVASVTGCAGFAAVCGESIPTAMTMASVALPSMREKGYDPAFGCACLALGGTLGILIPPSLGFIMYAIITEQSVGKLFLAGIFPGLLLLFIICGIIVIRAIHNPSLAPRGNKTTYIEKIKSLTGILPMLILFTIIMGGILTGLCSPNEGGAIGAFSTLLYCLFKKRLSFAMFIHALKSTSMLTGKIFFVLLGVNILGYFLVATRLPFALTDLIIAYGTSKYIVLSATILLYIILGCLMNVIPMIMLTLPALFPTILAMGFDPIWFGVIVVLLMELGQITPPIGVLVFAMSGAVPDVPVQNIYKHVLPFFVGILLCIMLLILFPQICLFLPTNF